MGYPLAITAIENGDPKSPLVLWGDLMKSLQEAARMDYDAVEIHVPDARDFPVDLVAAACQEYGIRISAIVTGRIFTRRGLCMTSPDPQNRNACMAELRDYIRIAARLKATAGVVIGWVKGNRPEGAGREFDQLMADQLREIARFAADLGQKILVEVINRYECNIFVTCKELKQFLLDWDIPNCYIHLDTFHMNLEEKSLPGAVREAGDLLGYFHVADSNRLCPGRGHIDFPAVFQALDEIGYRGTVSLECIPEPDSITVALEAKKFLTNAMNLP